MAEYPNPGQGHDPGEDALGWMCRVRSECAMLFGQDVCQVTEVGAAAGVLPADGLLDPDIFQDVEQISREVVRQFNREVGVPDMRRLMVDIPVGQRFGMIPRHDRDGDTLPAGAGGLSGNGNGDVVFPAKDLGDQGKRACFHGPPLTRTRPPVLPPAVSVVV